MRMNMWKISVSGITILLFVVILMMMFFSSCGTDDTEPVGSQDWLTGDTRQKLETITDHLRGFDMAMVETGYRYSELYWAGYDENWEYARYQIQKIELALERGLERRPARAESAQPFMNQSIPEMGQAVESEDPDHFMREFENFTQSCNSCHAAEEVPHFHVKSPKTRQSPIMVD
jgi:hypothetical protein